MRLRLRDGDHGIEQRPTHPGRPLRCNAAPSQGRRSLGDALEDMAEGMVELQCGSVSGTEITSRANGPTSNRASSPLQCGSVSGTEITRRAARALAPSSRLQCGSVSGTEITTKACRESSPPPTRCNAAPSQGRRSRATVCSASRCDDRAAMRLRLRDGDHAGNQVRAPRDFAAAMRLRLRDGDHRITREPQLRPTDRAAMRLRLRDGDHRA